jgi:hypothetical protein
MSDIGVIFAVHYGQDIWFSQDIWYLNMVKYGQDINGILNFLGHFLRSGYVVFPGFPRDFQVQGLVNPPEKTDVLDKPSKKGIFTDPVHSIRLPAMECFLGNLGCLDILRISVSRTMEQIFSQLGIF